MRATAGKTRVLRKRGPRQTELSKAMGSAPMLLQAGCLPLLYWLGVVTSMAIGVGNAGNDLSNAMGVTVGSRVLTLKHAVAVGTLFDGLGGLLMGGRVTNTISAGVLNPELYKEDPSLLAKAMLVVMFAGGTTMLTATFGRVPISAHHSVVGSLVAVGLLTKGVSSIQWKLVCEIVISWVGNPLIGLFTSFGLFVWLDAFLFSAAEPAAAFAQHKWLIYLCSFLTCMPFVLANSPQISLGTGASVLVSAAMGVIFAGYSELLQSWLQAAQKSMPGSNRGAEHNYDEADVGSSSEEEQGLELTRDGLLRAESLRAFEACFGPLLVLSAISVAFVHGAQDVSNAVGPLSQIVLQAQGSVGGPAPGLPWPLLLGVCSFVLGDLTLGYKVIDTVGTKITDMTPSRAFAAQMGTVIALTSATMLALPVSTSECMVGSVVGVGLGKKWRNHADASLNVSVLRKIWAAWLLTVPYAAMIAAIFFQLVESLCKAST